MFYCRARRRHREIVAKLEGLRHQLEMIMVTQVQHAADLDAIAAKADKIGAETRTLLVRIEELIDAQDDNTSPEVDAAVARLQTQMQVVDDLVADVAP